MSEIDGKDTTIICGAHNSCVKINLDGEELKYFIHECFKSSATHINKGRTIKQRISLDRLRSHRRDKFTEMPLIADSDIENIKIIMNEDKENVLEGNVVNVKLTDNNNTNKIWYVRAVKEMTRGQQKTPRNKQYKFK